MSDQNISLSAEVVHYSGYIQQPGGGREQIDFSVKSGASQVEIDAAAFQAIRKRIEVDFLEIGRGPVLDAEDGQDESPAGMHP